MATDADVLAAAIQAALGDSAEDLTERNKALAKAIVSQLTTLAVVSFAAGSVTGTCPPGGPLSGGAATGGTVSGLSKDKLANDVASSQGGSATANVKTLASGICSHLATASVTFAAGTVTGVCSNSPLSPGAFVGQASGGVLSGLSAPALAQLIAQAFGGKVSQKLLAMAGAIVDHAQQKAEAYFPSGLTGVAPAGGGALAAGLGVFGKVK